MDGGGHLTVFRFSARAKSLWAKKSRDTELKWLSLPAHLADAAEVAGLLWRDWVPKSIKRTIAAGMSRPDEAEQLFVFLGAIHDLGKATPAFAVQSCGYYELDERIYQHMLDVGLPMERKISFPSRSKSPHALASYILLEESGCPKSVAVVLGAHHGKPPGYGMLVGSSETYYKNYYLNRQEGAAAWKAVQRELIDYALQRSGYRALSELPELRLETQMLLAGLLITVDWIASDPDHFPLLHLENTIWPDSVQRAWRAWQELGFSRPIRLGDGWLSAGLVYNRFGFQANVLQREVQRIATDVEESGILVVEAPMGSGKTEAALAAAEIWMARNGSRGIYFGLPTQATSDGVFPRICNWMDRFDEEEMQSIHLLHGKAALNSLYQKLANGTNIEVDDTPGVYVHEWFAGRKRSMLGDFVIGTIDQLLLAGLKQKHVMLRHLGLANKVIIIDEVHAYDIYMSSYLIRTLNWLGAYRVPVIVLSATLPAAKRRALIEAYRNRVSSVSAASEVPALSRLGRESGNILNKPIKLANNNEAAVTDASAVREQDWGTTRAYPLLTYTNGERIAQEIVAMDVSQKSVQLSFLADEAIADNLFELLSEGGCAGVIVNSVRRAQELAQRLQRIFGAEQIILHSRFLGLDRIKREGQIMQELGKPASGRQRPHLRIVIGTQVLEQSLDIDFDVLLTDICPVDLLLQRIGRLHRHLRDWRPERLRHAVCYVLGVKENQFDSAAVAVYGEYLLMRTRARLPEKLLLPADISEMVQDVYDAATPLVPESDAYLKAKEAHDRLLEKKRQEAETFRLGSPFTNTTMIGMLDVDVSDARGEATVRDTVDSIEVLLVQRNADGRFGFLPWIEEGEKLYPDQVPDDRQARVLACCGVRLPPQVCGYFQQLDRTIDELEKRNKDELSVWQQAPLLKGMLFLILDERLTAYLGKYKLTYTREYGLEYAAKEGEGNGYEEGVSSFQRTVDRSTPA